MLDAKLLGGDGGLQAGRRKTPILPQIAYTEGRPRRWPATPEYFSCSAPHSPAGHSAPRCTEEH
eukprot:435789-Prymnesium_polylepis.1